VLQKSGWRPLLKRLELDSFPISSRSPSTSLVPPAPPPRQLRGQGELVELPDGSVMVASPGNRRTKRAGRPEDADLPARVADFIRDAQLNYRRFFATTEANLFPRIIERMTATGSSEASGVPSVMDVRARLRALQSRDERALRYGLESDTMEYGQIDKALAALKGGKKASSALAILVIYVEVLEARCTQRDLIADRLETFERVLADFFLDKHVKAGPGSGLEIFTAENTPLGINDLSSGEYHLLYLMVATLVTKRRGTVIAIDEPEMSMHIGWQRRLVRALFECASKAQPQFILATHSPDIAAEYPDHMISFAPKGTNAKAS
ncbi:MAG: AAA family ATPase, partial [Myxococcota bacterium]